MKLSKGCTWGPPMIFFIVLGLQNIGIMLGKIAIRTHGENSATRIQLAHNKKSRIFDALALHS